jgi:hypothetical protein
MDKKIVVVRMLTGEELLTTHVGTDSDTFEFHNTIQLMAGNIPDPRSGKAQSLGLLPWMTYTNAREKVYINKNAVAFMADPADSLRVEYQKATGSIVTPKTGLILP